MTITGLHALAVVGAVALWLLVAGYRDWRRHQHQLDIAAASELSRESS